MTLMLHALDEQAIFIKSFAKARDLVPPDWHFHELDAPVKRRKTKVTVRLDEDLVKWFRHIGFGYQNRMNAVLRAYMLSVLAKYVECEGDRSIDGTPL